MAEKNREPLTVFRWRKDADGYVLGDDGRINRRGGRLEEYDPATVRPHLHRIFAELPLQAVEWHELLDTQLPSALTHDAEAPIHQRRFETLNEAFLAFVNEFGFLGSDRSGADSESEDVSYLFKMSNNLSGITAQIDLLNKRSSLTAALIEAGRIPGTVFGPNVRMVMKPKTADGRLQFYYEPESLYAWMWLRTADDANLSLDWSGSPCLYCHEPMGRGPGGHRQHARFCCDNHRTNFHRLPRNEQRERMAMAKALAREDGAS